MIMGMRMSLRFCVLVLTSMFSHHQNLLYSIEHMNDQSCLYPDYI